MKTFIGIGSDHETDVCARAMSILSESCPDAITLEQKIWYNPIKRGGIDDKKTKQLLRKKGLEFRVNKAKSRTIIIAGEMYVSGDPDAGLEPETTAGIQFALTAGIPFYFLGMDQVIFKNMIFEFKDKRVKAISLNGRTTYQNYKGPGASHGTDTGYSNECIPVRNLFVSDGLNYLFEQIGYTCLVHIGGRGHFDISIKPDQSDPFASWVIPLHDKKFELQNLVRADRKIVYDLVRNKIVREM